MLPLGIRELSLPTVAEIKAKEYRHACDYCLSSYVLESALEHCYHCHETFADSLWELHRYRGGCRFPGNLSGFYEIVYSWDLRIWFKKEENDEGR